MGRTSTIRKFLPCAHQRAVPPSSSLCRGFRPQQWRPKAVLHSPSSCPAMTTDNREVLLTAIARAPAWIDDLVEGRVASFAEIAKQEDKVEGNAGTRKSRDEERHPVQATSRRKGCATHPPGASTTVLLSGFGPCVSERGMNQVRAIGLFPVRQDCYSPMTLSMAAFAAFLISSKCSLLRKLSA